jgi:hypothetical protein
MKAMIFTLVVLGGMVSCKDIDSPDSNPRNGLHGASNLPGVDGGQPLAAGQFVMTVIDNASFFNNLPMGEARPDLLLPKHTSMRVIAPSDSYSKVELDNGQVGYVLSAQMVSQRPVISSGGADRSFPTGGVPDRIPAVVNPQLPPIVPVD